jgi:hypothetical protein
MPTTTYLSCADTAKLLRQALKAAFPGVKFSVRSSTYSGGASITVAWNDGPTSADVDATAKRYAGATFDGMRDLKEHHSTLLADEDGNVAEVHFGADFVFTSRTITDAGKARAEASAAQALHPAGDDGTCDACRLLAPAGVGGYLDRHRGGWYRACSTACAARLLVTGLDLRGLHDDA